MEKITWCQGHLEAPGQSLCGGPQYHDRMLWNASIVTSPGLLPQRGNCYSIY